jgi:hypothetical protein
VENIIEDNTMERHPVEEGVPQGSPVSPILFGICTSGLIKRVEEDEAEGQGISFLDERGMVATGRNDNQVVMILERCAAMSIEWAGRRGLQFDTAKTQAAQFPLRQGHK